MRFFVFAIVFSTLIQLQAQIDTSAWYRGIIEWQTTMNREYADSTESPLEPSDRLIFTGLEFFEPDSSYCVKAHMELTPDSQPFDMKTSGVRTPSYRQYGILYFDIKGQQYSLSAYQRIEFSTSDDYVDYLFVPFTDLSNGEETYEGGRYIDLQINAGGNYTLDFNKAYNPYCAYNHKYSCPIPPAVNNLEIAIFAGVKKSLKH